MYSHPWAAGLIYLIAVAFAYALGRDHGGRPIWPGWAFVAAAVATATIFVVFVLPR
jgi:hypothetical protein